MNANREQPAGTDAHPRFSTHQVEQLILKAESATLTASEKSSMLDMLRAYADSLDKSAATDVADLVQRMIRAERERETLKRKIESAPRGVVRVPSTFGAGQRSGALARIECDDRMVGWTVALVRIER